MPQNTIDEKIDRIDVFYSVPSCHLSISNALYELQIKPHTMLQMKYVVVRHSASFEFQPLHPCDHLGQHDTLVTNVSHPNHPFNAFYKINVNIFVVELDYIPSNFSDFIKVKVGFISKAAVISVR